MHKKVVISLCTFCLVLCFIIVTMQKPVDAYLNGLAFGANPALLDLDLDLDYLTRLAAVDSETSTLGGLYGLYGIGGLYGLYGTGGLYGLYGLGTLPLLNYIGYLFGTYGTNIDSIYTSPAGLSPNIWSGYGFTYNPLFGYYHPLDVFSSMFALTNLFTWW
ncbi:MAG: hypothetical protein ACMUIU_14610 [bacterium]